MISKKNSALVEGFLWLDVKIGLWNNFFTFICFLSALSETRWYKRPIDSHTVSEDSSGLR